MYAQPELEEKEGVVEEGGDILLLQTESTELARVV
jgi:hypothetical protein